MNNIKKLQLVQRLIIAAMIVFLLAVLLSNHTKNVKEDTLVKGLTKNAKGISDLSQGNGLSVKKAFGLDPADYDYVIYFNAQDIMDVSEVLVVKTSNSDALDAAAAGVESRIDEQKTNFNGYGTNQMDLLNHAVEKEVGDYYFYAVSENASQWEKTFLSIVR